MMRNLSRTVRILSVALFALTIGPCAMNAQQQQAQQKNPPDDPNFPGVISPPGLNITWSQYTAGSPSVLITDPNAHEEKAAQYLGWNEQGSWLLSSGTGKIYIWNLSRNSVIKAYDNYKQIPPDILATLRNNPYAVAKHPVPQPPAHSEGPKPLTPDTSRQAAYFSGYQPPMGGIYGTGAGIQNGILTFTRADKTKASYKVVRPKAAQGAPGNAGAWIALETGGKGILFNVGADNSVTGHELPAQLIQALTQAPAQ